MPVASVARLGRALSKASSQSFSFSKCNQAFMAEITTDILTSSDQVRPGGQGEVNPLTSGQNCCRYGEYVAHKDHLYAS
ncbi:hypothetical protein PF010_g28730 [Phytophthora fragariae]|uniref:Uncharacterized protein n=2 Tax=Phytophthora fragariae TaxID=53985 RepID=A0A6G0JQ94_9STRA|nr:hypothetical protein PF010_g28730 [Phytophthora fragariae]KAE9169485.1 hypothetical protein PF004_g28167 [Phytophthora fragariae]